IGWIDYFISKGAKFNEESDGFDEACKSDKVEVLEHWIKNGGVVPNNPEYLCINMACLLGNFKMVKLLVENGVDLSDPKTNGVRIACRLGFTKTLKYLLDNNAVLGRICRYQLEYACLTEDIGLVKIILGYYDNLGVLEKRETSNTKEDEEPQNDSLLDNENSGHSEKYKITNTLLETGEPIQNSDLVDGIKASASVANIEILKLLLTYKINYNGNYNDNFEIDEAAVQTGNVDVVKTFLDNGISVDGDEVTLDIAFREKNTEMIKLLLRHGAKVKSDSNNLCLYFGVIDTETLLLMLTCCTELKDDQHLLEFAVCKNNLEAVKLLLKDTISLKDSKYNFVFYACENNNLEILKFLFEKGAKIEKGRLSGVSQACKNNNLEMLKLLLERNPNLVLNVDYGLKEAIDHKNMDMIKLLIMYGADISTHRKSIMEVASNLNNDCLTEFCQNRAA
ncbi:putative ankyrin repeat protein L63, partial [Zancudomyces culisetae]